MAGKETVFFKATRPDGTDFYTGRIDYGAALLSGEVVTHHVARQVKGDAATYLSVCTVPTDCTGMQWPCRLFRVEPAGCLPLLAGGSLPNKRRLHALKVVEELPAHEVFGPQGEAVAALIERAGRLTPEEASRLYAAKGAAWDAAKGAARDAAWDAAWDAVGALVVKDLVTVEQFDALYSPWAEVFSLPKES